MNDFEVEWNTFLQCSYETSNEKKIQIKLGADREVEKYSESDQ